MRSANSNARRLPLLLLVLASALASSCSIRQFAIDRVADALAGNGSTFAADDDPELVADAAPFSLKLIESVLAETPEHRELLLTACASFTQYAYGFLRQRADELQESDLQGSRQVRSREKRLLRRARDYGLRALEVAHHGFATQIRGEPLVAVRMVDAPRDVGLLYWTAAAWGLLIGESKDDPAILAGQPSVEALIDRALQLGPDYEHGAIHAFLVTYEMSRRGAKGDAAARAREHFRRALELSGGSSASCWVALAESVALARGDSKLFREACERAAAIDADAEPGTRLQNLLAQRRARWLLGRIDELFTA